MKTRILSLAFMTAFAVSGYGQKLATRNGYVKFFSKTPVENIEAENNQVSSVIDTESGDFAFLVQIKAFRFEKALMQEHFNENYMESGKYPQASFQGSIDNFSSVNLKKEGEYPVTLKGTMNIHGQEQKIVEEAVVVVKGEKVSLNSKFKISPKDYGVKIPAAKKDNIADVLDVTVKMDYDKK